MKKKQKVSLVIFMGLVLTLLASSENAQAKTDWKNYFSTEESKAIKKMVEKNILDSLENPNKDWKGVIDKKVVGDGVSKKKVYTGTYVGISSASASNVDADGTHYYQKFEAPIDDDDFPNITIWERASEYDAVAGKSAWSNDSTSYFVADGEIWVHIAQVDEEETVTSEGEEYKIVLTY